MLNSQPSRLKKGQATRRDFLEAGESVFARFGYVKAEVGAVIVEAGRARGTFYVHFKNKADLLRASVAQFQLEIEKAGLSEDKPFYGPPRAYLRLMWAIYRNHAGTFRALVEAAAVEEEFAQLYIELRTYVRRDVRAMLASHANGNDNGHATEGFIATALETMIVNCMYDWLAAAPKAAASPDEAAALEAMIIIVERFCQQEARPSAS